MTPCAGNGAASGVASTSGRDEAYASQNRSARYTATVLDVDVEEADEEPVRDCCVFIVPQASLFARGFCVASCLSGLSVFLSCLLGFSLLQCAYQGLACCHPSGTPTVLACMYDHPRLPGTQCPPSVAGTPW